MHARVEPTMLGGYCDEDCMSEEYVVYGGELSYFTRKLEAALVFYGANWRRAPKTPEVEARAATHQVPVLHTPENWVIADTTPLLRLLDGRFPHRAMFPTGPLGVAVHAIEEYFDEWIARTMVHYRWHYEESAKFAALRMAGGDEARAATVLSWGQRACRATGTESEHQQRAAEDEYRRILTAAEAQLGDSAFLLGDRPTAVDCIVLGGLRAHTYMDPTPKRVTAEFPTVVDWTTRRADTWTGGGELMTTDSPTPFARFILDEMRTTYVPYALAARDAVHAGAKAFHAEIYDEPVSYLTRTYIEQSRRMVVNRIADLSADERAITQRFLDDNGLIQVFA